MTTLLDIDKVYMKLKKFVCLSCQQRFFSNKKQECFKCNGENVVEEFR